MYVCVWGKGRQRRAASGCHIELDLLSEPGGAAYFGPEVTIPIATEEGGMGIFMSVTDQAYQISDLELGRKVLRDQLFVSKDLPTVTSLIQQGQSCGRRALGEEGYLILGEGAWGREKKEADWTHSPHFILTLTVSSGTRSRSYLQRNRDPAFGTWISGPNSSRSLCQS